MDITVTDEMISASGQIMADMQKARDAMDAGNPEAALARYFACDKGIMSTVFAKTPQEFQDAVLLAAQDDPPGK